MAIFLIEKAWWDPLENRDDFGYEVIGYVKTESEAKRVCESAGNLRGDETWSLKIKGLQPNPVPAMRYKILNEINDLGTL